MILLPKSFWKTSLNLLIVFIIECLFAVVFYSFYSLFSYSRKNEIIFYSIVTGMPCIYNLWQLFKSYSNGHMAKAVGFLILTAIYAYLVLSAVGAQGR